MIPLQAGMTIIMGKDNSNIKPLDTFVGREGCGLGVYRENIVEKTETREAMAVIAVIYFNRGGKDKYTAK